MSDQQWLCEISSGLCLAVAAGCSLAVTLIKVIKLICTACGPADKTISCWHEIPLWAGEEELHFICEIPKETAAKMEVATVSGATAPVVTVEHCWLDCVTARDDWCTQQDHVELQCTVV
eukprot:GHUV01033380.1.p2 GENE.GHUV01033380.1~~GHUV01033380.1.p2  ORF type:complete len:119 (-),score=29.89 GHUV01033380.1:691-1047(-)